MRDSWCLARCCAAFLLLYTTLPEVCYESRDFFDEILGNKLSRNGPSSAAAAGMTGSDIASNTLRETTFCSQTLEHPIAADMTGKRPYEPDGSNADAKRIRSNDGSPAPAPNQTSQGSAESEIERKKREAAERMAAVKARLAASKTNGPAPVARAGAVAGQPALAPPGAGMANGALPGAGVGTAPDVEAKKAEAQRKIAEMKARMAAQREQAPGPAVGRTASPVNGAAAATPPQAQQMSDREARIAEARARAAELSRQRNTSSPAQPVAPAPAPPRQDGRGAKGGLGVGLHPSLMGDMTAGATAAGKGKGTLQGPKFSTTKGKQQAEAPRINPYITAEDEAAALDSRDQDSQYDPNVAARKGGDRKSKQLVFNPKGKFMAQANALRQQARLEEMKKRIALETRKVEIEEASDKAFLVPAPPEVEWWDEGLLPENQNSYADCLDEGRNKIETEDSIITALIQHPVMLQPPQDKFIPAPKPLMLTQTEQKKLRRQRRMADMKEEQAKIRLGLVEPPPPKVKKSNMMRVLGEQAVKDPTAVEARVNREIAQRASDHARANEDRRLTKEQREEKLKAQQASDEAKGVKIAVFRVDNLSSGKHRYQVDVNAKQNALTGIVVLHPTMNLIIVEGGTHSINNYTKLMLNRIKWAENTLPLGSTNAGTFTGSAERRDANASAEGEGGGSKASKWCSPLDENGVLKDLSENRCLLVWEGEQAQRSFKKWGSKAVETDGEARDVLGRMRMENMWTLARSK